MRNELRSWILDGLVASACLIMIVNGSVSLKQRFVTAGADLGTTRPIIEDSDNLIIDLKEAGARTAGEATTVIIEFSDFQCPYCGKYANETFGKLRREF